MWTTRRRAAFPLRRALSSRAAALGCDVAAYHRDGFTVPSWSLPPERLRLAQEALDRLLDENKQVMPEQLVSAHLVGDGSGSNDGAVRGQAQFLELASSPEIADLAAACLGTDDVILWACQIFCKPAGTGKSVPWHQDGQVRACVPHALTAAAAHSMLHASVGCTDRHMVSCDPSQYWPIEPLRAVTAWIALDRSDDECGALQYVPGTHAREPVLVPHVQRNDAGAAISYVADPALLPPALLASARTLTLEPGQVSLHDAMVLHGSGPNTSSRRRAGVAATFMPAECHFYRDRPTEGALKGGLTLDFSSRPLFVVKGRNRHPDNELVHDLVDRGCA